jgi:acyl-CoA synthetase (AMP-forming)/AMP-acid ligase II
MPVTSISPERHRTVVSVLREAAQVNGDLEAYVEPRRPDVRPRHSMTFGEWDRAADGVAGLLAEWGIQKGDVVCLMLPSSIDYAVIYAALLRLGAITSGINPRLGPREVESIIRRTSPVLFVREHDATELALDQAVRLVELADLMAGRTGDPPASFPSLSEHDPVAVVWTSALFDHANLAAVARGTDVLGQPGDRRLSPHPFAHVGYMTRAWDEVAHAVTTVISPTPWRADETVRILVEEAISVAQAVPTQWALMMACQEFHQADLSAIRLAATGAARMPSSDVTALRTRLGVPVVVRYTSTESSLGTGTTLTSSDDEVATTVGRPVPGVELRIVDDDGVPVAPGTVGRVHLRSGAAMRGYWGGGPGRGRALNDLIDVTATAEVRSADGWITTGDFGLQDARGNLQLVGRAHERYIRGGYNVYPAEVEEVLATHPSVGRVAVVGAADPVLGEIGVAIVVASGDDPPELESLRTHCIQQLSDYKAPDALVMVDEIPLTPMMKVDPRQLAPLAERAAAERLARRAQGR